MVTRRWSVAVLFIVGLGACYVTPAPGPGTAVVPGPVTANLAVTNQSSGTVCYINVSACAETNWGPDILGTEVLPPGQSAVVTVHHGCWDLRAQDCDQNTLATQMGMQVSGDTTWLLH